MSTYERAYHFFQELKRRHVYRVAAGYAVAAWLIIQVAATALPYLHAPEWLITGIIIAMLAGFPIALLLAWLFELTPQGIQREHAHTAGGASSTFAQPHGAPVPSAPPVAARPAGTPASPPSPHIRLRWERLGPALVALAGIATGGWLWSARAARGGPSGLVPLEGYDQILNERVQRQLRSLEPTLRKVQEDSRRAAEEAGRHAAARGVAPDSSAVLPEIPVPPAIPVTQGGAQPAGLAAVAREIDAGHLVSVAVLPFTAVAGKDAGGAGIEVADSLRARIDAAGRLHAVPGSLVRSAAREVGLEGAQRSGYGRADARRLPARALGDAYVVGRIVEGSQGRLIEASLYAAGDHRLLSSASVAGLEGQMPDLLRRLLEQLLPAGG